MPRSQPAICSDLILVNGCEGDPVLYLDYPDRDNAVLFDAGDVAALDAKRLADLDAVFLTHHHADHFSDLDRIIRANLNSDKTVEIFGPSGTIERVYDRVRSYAHSYFPFQKLVLSVNDVMDDQVLHANLEYSKRFPEPNPQIRAQEGNGELWRNTSARVFVAPTDHTVPGLAYALVENSGYSLNEPKIDSSSLRRGPWLGELIQRMVEANGEIDKDDRIRIEGGVFSVSELANRFLVRSTGHKFVYIVDTLYDPETTTGQALKRLAQGADRLFGDCFYRDRDAKAAAKHHHLTTSDLARLAIDAKVKRITPIHFSGRYAGQGERTIEELRGHLAGSKTLIVPAEKSAISRP
ncbi:MAG: MBL fold metallo-hydrolase [Planctomycetota bacterium]